MITTVLLILLGVAIWVLTFAAYLFICYGFTGQTFSLPVLPMFALLLLHLTWPWVPGRTACIVLDVLTIMLAAFWRLKERPRNRPPPPNANSSHDGS